MSTYPGLVLSVPAQFHAAAYQYGIHDMFQVAILHSWTFCTLQRSLKQIILDDNDYRREQFEDIKREDMEWEARMEARDYEKDDFSITNLQEND